MGYLFVYRRLIRRERKETVNLTTTVNQKQLLDILLNVGLVRPIFIWGQVGIGKSSIVEQFAEQVGLPDVYKRQTQYSTVLTQRQPSLRRPESKSAGAKQALLRRECQVN